MRNAAWVGAALLVAACGGEAGTGASDSASLIEEDSWSAMGLLAVANRLSAGQSRTQVGLASDVAQNIYSVRLGDDGVAETADDHTIGSVAELDAIPRVTPTAIQQLLEYAEAKGYIDALKRAVPYEPNALLRIEGQGQWTRHTQYWTTDGNCVKYDETLPFSASAELRALPEYDGETLRHRFHLVNLSTPWFWIDSNGTAGGKFTNATETAETTEQAVAYDEPWTVHAFSTFLRRSMEFVATSAGLQMRGSYLNDMNAGSCSGAGSDFYALDVLLPWPSPAETVVDFPDDPSEPGDEVASPLELGVGDLVVTEFMANPSICPDATGEWVEVLNASSRAVRLSGLVVRNRVGSAGTVISEEIVSPGARAVVARGSAETFCGRFIPDGYYGPVLTLGNTKDRISLLAGSGGSIIDSTCEYGSSLAKSGRSATLSGTASATGNDSVSAWTVATPNIAGSTEKGTPGTP